MLRVLFVEAEESLHQAIGKKRLREADDEELALTVVPFWNRLLSHLAESGVEFFGVTFGEDTETGAESYVVETQFRVAEISQIDDPDDARYRIEVGLFDLEGNLVREQPDLVLTGWKSFSQWLVEVTQEDIRWYFS